jgi:pentatricopeptide repeat protein
VLLTLLARARAATAAADTITWAEGHVAVSTSHYNRLVDAYAATDDAVGARRALERISQRGHRPNTASYAALLGYASMPSFDSAGESLYCAGQMHWLLTIYSSVGGRAYERCGMWNEAVDMFDGMVRAGVDPTEECYVKIIRYSPPVTPIESPFLGFLRP